MTFSNDARANALAAVVAAAVGIAVLPDYFLYAMALWIFREIYFRPTVVEPLPIPEMATSLDDDAKELTRNPRVCVVTGASGFLARHLINQLAASGDYDEIRAVDIVAPAYASPKVASVTANICDAAAVLKFVRGADVVFHVASLIELRDHKYRRNRLFDVNVTGAMNIINACIRTGVTRLVYTSSTATVMDNREVEGAWNEEAFAEVDLDNLPCYYAITKRMAELNVLKANGRGRLHTVALRPFVPFGAGDRLQTERIAYEDILAQTHDGENRTAFVYCKNAAHWHYLAAKTLAQNPAVGGQAYFISNGDDGVVPVKAMRAGIVKHRKKPIKFDFSLTPTTRAIIFLGNAVFDWCTAGRINHHVLSCNKNAMPYTLTDGPFDASKGMKTFGYKPLYTMEEAYADLARDLKIC